MKISSYPIARLKEQQQQKDLGEEVGTERSSYCIPPQNQIVYEIISTLYLTYS